MKKHAEFFTYSCPGTEEREFYRKEGFLRLGRTLTDRGIESMREQCMKAWTIQKEAFDAGKNWLQNTLLNNIHHSAPIVRDYYFEGPLLDVVESFIGPNLKGVTAQLTFKLRGNTLPVGWHQDNGYGELEPYNAVTCLTALDATDEENGCLWIIPGSHKEGQLHTGLTLEDKKKRAAINLEPDESKAVPVPMKAGECLIFNCWMLHRSDGNRSHERDRRILFLRYADADAVEVYNRNRPRLGRLVRGETRYAEVAACEADL